MLLPKPDRYGNYWFGQRDGENVGPAIFPSKRLVVDEHDESKKTVVNNGTWIVFLGRAKGFIFAGPQLARYATIQAAVAAMESQSDEFWGIKKTPTG